MEHKSTLKPFHFQYFQIKESIKSINILPVFGFDAN